VIPDSLDTLKIKESIKYTGITISYSYDLVKFLYGWVTVAPGLIGGYTHYDYSNITEEYSPTDSNYIETRRDTATNQSYLGGHVDIEIGNQLTDNIGAYAYLNTNVLYLSASPIIARMDFGLKVTYKF
jgi:hypothetical protein